MGGAVSELRHSIHAHVVIAQHYPTFLEPYLVVVQFFLRTAETGEGADPDRPVDELPMDVVISDKRKIFEEASTEIELLVENRKVMAMLLRGIRTYRTLALAPDLDPLKRWYDPPWRRDNKPMPRFLDISADEVLRFQIAVLRTSIRCLRLMMFCSDARALLEELGGPEILNQAVLENALDDFVKNDVKAIFSAVYGGDNAVRRIAIANVQITLEMMKENLESAIVQLAGVRRLCQLLTAANAISYTPAVGESNRNSENVQVNETTAAPLFQDIDTFGAVALVTSSLRRFDVDKYLSLYVHICRFISFVAVEGELSLFLSLSHCRLTVEDILALLPQTLTLSHFNVSVAEHNTKLIGQHGGVEGVINLLFKARAMQREKKQAERDEAAYQEKLLESPQSDWQSIVETKEKKRQSKAASALTAPPPAPVVDTDSTTSGAPVVVVVANLASLAVVDFTPTEIGQQAMWALDLLATLNFNVSQMKLHKLKYLLEEIRLDPDGKELGEALIVTRRLRLIRWDQIGFPPGSSSSSAPASPKKVGK